MMLWLLNYLGVKGLAKWAVRLVFAVLLFVVLLVAGAVLYQYPEARAWVVVLAVVAVGWKPFRAWLSRRNRAEAVERTIDGKIVPENLAVAALAVPEQSPDFEYVMRGLPDYSKMMLKLDVAEFEYVPEIPQAVAAPIAAEIPGKLPELPEEEAAASRAWAFGLPRWAMAAGAAAVLLFGSLAIITFSNVTEQGTMPRGTPPQYQTVWEMSHTHSWLRHHYLEWRWHAQIAAELAAAPAAAPPQEAQSSNDPSTVAAAQQPRETQNNGGLATEEKISPPPSSIPEATPTVKSSTSDEKRGNTALRAVWKEINEKHPEQVSWRDASTGLLWDNTDNGDDAISWPEAMQYCQASDVAARKDWRLPTLTELKGMLDGERYKAPGGILLTKPFEVLWSSTPASDGIHHRAYTIGTAPEGAELASYTHALCVHD